MTLHIAGPFALIVFFVWYELRGRRLLKEQISILSPQRHREGEGLQKREEAMKSTGERRSWWEAIEQELGLPFPVIVCLVVVTAALLARMFGLIPDLWLGP